jgi:hypothetical protein
MVKAGTHTHVSSALKRIMEDEGMELEIIINPKMNDDGQAVVQVRSAFSFCKLSFLYQTVNSSRLQPARQSSTSGTHMVSTFRVRASCL